MRGVDFEPVEVDGELWPEDVERRGNNAAASVALHDVYSWLGFESQHTYCRKLHRERERIFERATY